MVALDRVQERRPAVALARQNRNEEGLSIAEIARLLGRTEATVRAYFYDPSDANKEPSREQEAERGGRELRSHLPARHGPRRRDHLRATVHRRKGQEAKLGHCPPRPGASRYRDLVNRRSQTRATSAQTSRRQRWRRCRGPLRSGRPDAASVDGRRRYVAATACRALEVGWVSRSMSAAQRSAIM
jgi:hypothetical protein